MHDLITFFLIYLSAVDNRFTQYSYGLHGKGYAIMSCAVNHEFFACMKILSTSGVQLTGRIFTHINFSQLIHFSNHPHNDLTTSQQTNYLKLDSLQGVKFIRR